MRQPVTPQALQPKPMHMVRLCRPCPPQRHMSPSKLKATRGRYPASSSRVNRGKKMAMGGSITATTQAVVRYRPSAISPCSHSGAPREASPFFSGSSRENKVVCRSSEGALAPQMVR